MSGITINITLSPALEVALLRLIAPAAAPEDGVAALREAFAGLRRDFGRELWNVHAAIERIAEQMRDTPPGATPTGKGPAAAVGIPPQLSPIAAEGNSPVSCAPASTCVETMELPADDPESSRDAPARVAPSASAPASGQPARYRHTHWLTPPRRALLRAGWPAGVPTRLLRGDMENLPGPPLPDNAATAAAVMGVRRPAGFGTRGVAPAVVPIVPAPIAAPPIVPAPIVAAPETLPQPPPPPAVKRTPPKLPPVAANGKIYVAPADLTEWAQAHDVAFNGDMRPIDTLAKMLGLPPIVCDHTLGRPA